MGLIIIVRVHSYTVLMYKKETAKVPPSGIVGKDGKTLPSTLPTDGAKLEEINGVPYMNGEPVTAKILTKSEAVMAALKDPTGSVLDGAEALSQGTVDAGKKLVGGVEWLGDRVEFYEDLASDVEGNITDVISYIPYAIGAYIIVALINA